MIIAAALGCLVLHEKHAVATRTFPHCCHTHAGTWGVSSIELVRPSPLDTRVLPPGLLIPVSSALKGSLMSVVTRNKQHLSTWYMRCILVPLPAPLYTSIAYRSASGPQSVEDILCMPSTRATRGAEEEQLNRVTCTRKATKQMRLGLRFGVL